MFVVVVGVIALAFAVFSLFIIEFVVVALFVVFNVGMCVIDVGMMATCRLKYRDTDCKTLTK